jgi:hypothetical protein
MQLAPIEFTEWFNKEVREKSLGVREASRLIGISHPVVSALQNGAHPTEGVCVKVAYAFGFPVDVVLALAGHRPLISKDDEIIERAEHIINNYKRSETKERALAYLEFLRVEEEKGESRVKSAKYPAPSKP